MPLVRAIAGDLAVLSREVIERRQRLSMLLDGRAPDPNDPYGEELVQIEEELREDNRRLQEYAEELRDLGVEPSDASEGVVDFPAMIDGRKAYFCWKLGEPEVLHWREMDAGIKQRQPLAVDSVVGGSLPDKETGTDEA